MRKRLASGLILPMFLSFFVFLPISAQALTYTIDKVINGEGFTTGWDFGTVTLGMASLVGGQGVDIRVTLDDASDYIGSESHLKVIALNFSGNATGASFALISGDPILYDPDNVKMGGFKSDFDLRIPGEGNNIHVPDYWNVIWLRDNSTNAPIDIYPDDFNVATGGVYMAFHIGGLEKNIAESDSVWAGANPISPVPEPATVLLLGSGLLGLALFARRRLKSKT